MNGQKMIAVALGGWLVGCGAGTTAQSASGPEGEGTGTPSEAQAAAPVLDAPIAVGAQAPAFMLQDQTGRVRTLAEFRGHPVVLYYYPRDATPGCTREACGFRDAWDRLQAAGAVVLGASTDDVVSHQRFATDQQLPFPLLADLDGRVAQQLGVPMRMGMTGRITFLIDGEGTVRRVFENVDPAVHADEVLAAIAALPAAGSAPTQP